MNQKQVIIASLLLLYTLALSAAQNLNVHPKTGSLTSFTMANVKTLTYGGGNLTLTNRDASSSNFALASMGYLNFSDIATALASVQVKPLLSIYPNPVREVLNINLPLGWEAYAQLEIIDMGGKVVLQELLNSLASSISVSELPKGLYLLRVQNGTQSSNTKFIKQ